VLCASADSLDRGPHVVRPVQQVPAGGFEHVSFDPPALVNALSVTVPVVFESVPPSEVTVAPYDAVSSPVLERLVRVKCRMDAPEDDDGPALLQRTAHAIASQRISRMNSDTDDVARFDAVHIDVSDGLIPKDGVAKLRWRRRC
jgi:hypothetical protein